MEAHARTWTSHSRKLLGFLGAHPLRSQAPFMDMAISALLTGWTLMDHVSSLVVRPSFPPYSCDLRSSLLNFTFPLLLDIFFQLHLHG